MNEGINYKLLEKIEIHNYKTYLNSEIKFTDKVSTLVGPNECGKTNLLESINFLKNYQNLNNGDTCLYCEDAWKEEPSFIYHLNPHSLGLDGDLNSLKIKVSAKKVEIIEPNDFKSETKIIEVIKASFPIGGGGHVHIKIPPSLKPKYKLGDTITIKEGEEKLLPNLTETELTTLINHNGSTSLFNKIIFERNKTQEEHFPKKEEFVKKILEKIKIIYWKYDETKFIQDSLAIETFKQNQNQFKYILNMFKIAGIDIDAFFSASDIQITNMLSSINTKISDLIKKNWKEQNLDFFMGLGKNNNLITSFQENDRNIEPGKRSEGFKWYLSFLLDFNAQFGSNIENCLILLDEPGIRLHPGGQKILVKQIEELAKNNQIVYTTHLPFMINRMFPKRIIYLTKKKGITELKLPEKEGIFDDILLSSTLGYDFMSLSRWGDIIVFVEGITDEILFKKLILKKAEIDREIVLDLNEFSLNPINGVKNLENFIRVAQETKMNYLVFLDNDDIVKEYTKKYHKQSRLHSKTIDYLIFLDNNKTLEDYIPLKILNEAMEEFSESNNIFYTKYLEGMFFNESSIKNQLKEFVNKTNEKMVNDGHVDDEKINVGDLKLDLILQIVELINADNIGEFKELIDQIRKIKERSDSLNLNNYQRTL